MTIGSIATILGISKDRVREQLDEIGLDKKERHKFRNSNRQFAFGWHAIDGKKVKHPTEYKIIEDMIRWREEGMAFGKIADKLTELGIKGRLGSSKWDRGAVRRIIMRNQT